MQSALTIVGFDPDWGYLHTVRYGWSLLALELYFPQQHFPQQRNLCDLQ